MKTYRIELCFKIFIMVLFFSSACSAEEPRLRIEVKADQTSVVNGESVKVTAKITNNGQQDQNLQVWSCSYSDNWKTDNPYVYLDIEPCNKNGIINVVLKSHQVYEKELSLNITVPAQELTLDEVTFILGFRQAVLEGGKTEPLAWSNPITLKIKKR